MSILPAARGLLNSAIVESGPCTGPWRPSNATYGWEQTTALAGTQSDPVSALRRKNASELRDWPESYRGGGWFADATLLAEGKGYAEHYFETGKLNVATLAIGWNSFDGTSYTIPAIKELLLAGEFETSVSARWGVENVKPIKAKYAPALYFENSTVAAYVKADSDFCVACPSLEIAALASKRSHARIYAYEFSHFHRNCDLAFLAGVFPEVPPFTSTWASHAAELFFLFGSSSIRVHGIEMRCPFSPAELELAKEIRKHWASIARTQVPSPSAPSWPLFSPTSQNKTLVFSLPKSSIGTFTDADGKCDMWQEMR